VKNLDECAERNQPNNHSDHNQRHLPHREAELAAHPVVAHADLLLLAFGLQYIFAPGAGGPWRTAPSMTSALALRRMAFSTVSSADGSLGMAA
jgi:hypothetical protein